MVKQHYRWDFIGLSTDDKPTPETNEKVVDGSTFYCSDTSKLYVFCEGTWYERKPLGGGGGGTSDFEQLTNRPKYNGTEMTGDTNIPEVPAPYSLPIASSETLGGIKIGTNLTVDPSTGEVNATDTTYSSFTGTDGVDAGTSGLVPAPATTDADKFLKSDGTWATAGGGGGSDIIDIEFTDNISSYEFQALYATYGNGTYRFIDKSTNNNNKLLYLGAEGSTNPAIQMSHRSGDIHYALVGVSRGTVTLMTLDQSSGQFSLRGYTNANNSSVAGGQITGPIDNNLAEQYPTNESTRPLSAGQGRVLNRKILGVSSGTSVDSWHNIGTASNYTKRALQVTLSISESGLTLTADTWSSTGITLPAAYRPSSVVYGSIVVDNSAAYEAAILRVNIDGTVEIKSFIGGTNATGQVVIPVAS